MDIKATLATWLGNPEALRDDGIDPPTLTALRTAIEIADICPDFTRVVPDGDGGVAFATTGLEATHLGVDSEGSLDYTRWDGSEMQLRICWKMEEG